MATVLSPYEPSVKTARKNSVQDITLKIFNVDMQGNALDCNPGQLFSVRRNLIIKIATPAGHEIPNRDQFRQTRTGLQAPVDSRGRTARQRDD